MDIKFKDLIVEVLANLVKRFPHSSVKPEGVYYSSNPTGAVYGTSEKNGWWTNTGEFKEVSKALVVEPFKYKYKDGKLCIKYYLLLMVDDCDSDTDELVQYLIQFLNLLGTYSEGKFVFDEDYSECGIMDWNDDYEFDVITDIPNKWAVITKFDWCFCFEYNLGESPHCEIC